MTENEADGSVPVHRASASAKRPTKETGRSVRIIADDAKDIGWRGSAAVPAGDGAIPETVPAGGPPPPPSAPLLPPLPPHAPSWEVTFGPGAQRADMNMTALSSIEATRSASAGAASIPGGGEPAAGRRDSGEGEEGGNAEDEEQARQRAEADAAAAVEPPAFDAFVVEDERSRRRAGGSFAAPPLVDGSCVVPIREEVEGSRDPGQSKGAPRNSRRLAAFALLIASLAAVGVALGVTLSGREDEGSGPQRPSLFAGEVTFPVPTQPPPTQPPKAETERFRAYREALLPLYSSQKEESESLFDPSSAQYAALDWLANADLYESNETAPDGLVWRVAQRFALATLFFATAGRGGEDNSTPAAAGGGGGGWRDPAGFLNPTTHECDWYGPGTFEAMEVVFSRLKGVFCDSDSRVTIVMLPENSLNGRLPPEIGHLGELRALTLLLNELRGPLPASLYGLSHLEILWLQYNAFNGSIDPRVRNWGNLKALDLSGNFFIGEVPSDIGSWGSGGLTQLQLSNNFLTGTIPQSLGRLEDLTVVGFESNYLTGRIPDLFTRHLSLLQIGYNNLSESAIPAWVCDQTELTLLSMPGCGLTGTLPPCIGNLSHLGQLFLPENRMSGELPEEIGDLASLAVLDLNDNYFVGTLPSSLGRLSSVEVLSISGLWYLMHGTIPTELGGLMNLRVLALSRNAFTGSLPSELGLLPNLEMLVVADNRLDGTVPLTLAHLTSLFFLDLAWNDFTGSLDFLCRTVFNSSKKSLRADCHGIDPDVVCSCCKTCCSNEDFDGPILNCFLPK